MGTSFLVLGEAAIHYVWIGKHRLAIAATPQIFDDVQSLQEAFLHLFCWCSKTEHQFVPCLICPLWFQRSVSSLVSKISRSLFIFVENRTLALNYEWKLKQSVLWMFWSYLNLCRGFPIDANAITGKATCFLKCVQLLIDIYKKMLCSC